MKVFRITPGVGCNPCCEKQANSIVTWLEEAEVGETITVKILEMSENEYSELPEYMGP